MKHTKRLLALLLSLVLAFSLAMPVLAQDAAPTQHYEFINEVIEYLELDITGWRLTLFSGALYPYSVAADVFSFLPMSIAIPLQFTLLLPLTILLQPLFLIAIGKIVIPF